MKTNTLQYIIVFIGLMLSVTSIFVINNHMTNLRKKTTEKVVVIAKNESPNKVTPIIENVESETVVEEQTTTATTTTTTKAIIKEDPVVKEKPIKEEVSKEIIFDGLTLDELTNKLNKNLSSNLTDQGKYFATFAMQTGLDPYLSVAIVLHETGCKWNCSKLVRECNNVGGIKGKPSCNGGSYKSYETLEEGINSYLEMVNDKYYSKGLNTPELMNPKYAASASWGRAVTNYMEAIKSS